MRTRAKFDIEVALSLYEQGKGWREIARILSKMYKCKIHPYSVQFALTSRKLADNIGGAGRHRKWDLEEALRMREEGATLNEIGKVMGVSGTAIAKGLRELGH